MKWLLPPKYPSGGEKQLIQILTGEVPSGGLPADIGIVRQNIGSARAIYRAVCHGEPLISRVTTVTVGCSTPRNYDVLIGTPVQYLDLSHRRQSLHSPDYGWTDDGLPLQDTAVPIVKTQLRAGTR